MTSTYIIEPFAAGGDVTPIPVDAQPDGSISYTQGYSANYELNPLIYDSGLDITRRPMNYLFNIITQNLQQYQQFGTPDFITSADNGGSPFPYAKNSRVWYLGNVYISLIDSNTDTPPSANWKEGDLSVVKTWAGSTTQVDVVGDGTNIVLAGTNNEVITFQNGSGTGAFVTAAELRNTYWILTTDVGTLNNIVINPSPAFSTRGLILVQPAFTNTGAMTLSVNGSAPIPIIICSGVALRGGEMVAGTQYQIFFSGFLPGDAALLMTPCPDAAAQNGYYTTGDNTSGTTLSMVANPYTGTTVTLARGSRCTVYNTVLTGGNLFGVTLNWGGTGALPVRSPVATIVTNSIPAVAEFVIFTDLSYWVLLNPST